MNISKVVNSHLCLGCGICTIDKNVSGMHFHQKRGLNLPVIKGDKQKTSIADKVCPGKGYKIIENSSKYLSNNYSSLELGSYSNLFAAHSNNSRTLVNASSGGIITELLLYLLDKKIVDKVVVTRFIYTGKGPRTETFLSSNPEEIFESQGSKYCPVDISSFLKELEVVNYRIAFVGTPCQIAGLRAIMENEPRIAKKVLFTFSNFCGGFKSFNHVKKISSRHKIKFNFINYIRFRGGGQPGSMVLTDSLGNREEISYLEYPAFTGYSKMLRCHLCVDATGELSDASFGDAWLQEYMNDRFPWSFIIVRNSAVTSYLEEMAKDGLITLEDTTESKIVKSQYPNISSKKFRQKSRMIIYRYLGYEIPSFDGGFENKKTSFLVEFKIIFWHKLRLLIENVGLYPIFRMLLGRPY